MTNWENSTSGGQLSGHSDCITSPSPLLHAFVVLLISNVIYIIHTYFLTCHSPSFHFVTMAARWQLRLWSQPHVPIHTVPSSHSHVQPGVPCVALPGHAPLPGTLHICFSHRSFWRVLCQWIQKSFWCKSEIGGIVHVATTLYCCCCVTVPQLQMQCTAVNTVDPYTFTLHVQVCVYVHLRMCNVGRLLCYLWLMWCFASVSTLTTLSTTVSLYLASCCPILPSAFALS